MTDIIGGISASIDLAERLLRVAESFANASENMLKMELFHAKLNITRLKRIKTALQDNLNSGHFSEVEQADLKKAFETLQEELDEGVRSINQNLDHNPYGFNRAFWALWREDAATKLFRDISRQLDIVQGIVQLAKITPPLFSLNSGDKDNFKIHFPENRLNYAPLGYWAHADLASFGDGPPNPSQLKVFVESFRWLHGTSSDLSEVSKQAANTAKKIWCLGDNDSEFQTGLLPCLGFDEFRVVFLLPKNATECQTLRERILKTERAGKQIGVSLDARYALALQLAEAILQVHSAGLTHCAIRSDTILFLAPSEQGVTSNGPTGTVRGTGPGQSGQEPEEPRGPPPLQRASTMRRLRGRVNSYFGTRDPPPDEPRSNRKATKAEPKRQSSKRSLRNEGATRRAKRTGLFTFKHRRTSAEDLDNFEDDPKPVADNDPRVREVTSQNSTISNAKSVGDVPPGFGSVYLTNWMNVRYRGKVLKNRRRDWTKDIYRHPKQQSTFRDGPNMGHDIYSLGVCLIEIGLWESFVRVDGKTLVAGRLAEEAGVHEDDTHDADEVKKGLVKIAETELPGAMGEGYSKLVKACLTCLDGTGVWSTDFGRQRIDDDCQDFRKVVLSFLMDITKALT